MQACAPCVHWYAEEDDSRAGAQQMEGCFLLEDDFTEQMLTSLLRLFGSLSHFLAHPQKTPKPGALKHKSILRFTCLAL